MDFPSLKHKTRSIRAVPLLRPLVTMLIAFALPTAHAQGVPTMDPPRYGPFNAVILQGGTGIREEMGQLHDSVLQSDSPWTLSCWFRHEGDVRGFELIAGIGDVTSEYPRYLALAKGKVVLWEGKDNELSAPVREDLEQWHLLTATFDGLKEQLYLDGVAVSAGHLIHGTATPVIQIGPPKLVAEQTGHFGGRIASFQVLRNALTAVEVRELASAKPDFDTIAYTEASKAWPLQTRAQAGYRAPQSPDQLPSGRGPLSSPKALLHRPAGDSLRPSSPLEWSFADGWTMRDEQAAGSNGALISTPESPSTGWMRATVPGTVLTTLIDDGVYPDPYYGLNNLAIPETLNKQSYWFRNAFHIPPGLLQELTALGSHIELQFAGINYAAEVWLNGKHLGGLTGAFLRGHFNATSLLRTDGLNVLAVKISPPPHPGIPQEQSIKGGPGENGGSMEIDGPTFLATEGWDWIPAIRDRNAGIWQPVTLEVSHEAKLGDVQIVTQFRHHDTSAAAVTISVPLRNDATRPVDLTITAKIESVIVKKTVTAAPGDSSVVFTPAEFPQLTLPHPRLWWPNGYGRPELYKAEVELSSNGRVSDIRSTQFGIREITYELSLLDSQGALRRVDFTPAEDLHSVHPLIDVTHAGMREIASADAAALNVPEAQRTDYRYKTVVSSLPAGVQPTPSIENVSSDGAAPYLVIKVNGVRIAARGGNWGMDDARKRVSKERLEPYFRLHRDANLNIIRNWVGQNTEETFYELADKYGLMVWNDFWESTQDYNLEAQDPALFLENAADVIRHFRNHPSIVLWCGRNEGVPQPILNEGLEKLVRELDGTRFYSPSSNQVNLQQSGPYSYQDPAKYFTVLNRGFSVETGTPSMPTLESFQSTVPKEDWWPIDDVWAYHDWHASGNGLTEPFMKEMEAEFGAASSLADFERKAQMLNYVDHRAIFEGMNANLWQPNSGRLLWMTQPAWPSTMWQIFSSDYDTQASFYATKKACEPFHIQLNLANYQADVVNTGPLPKTATMSAKVYSLLTNELLMSRSEHRTFAADDVTHSQLLELGPLLKRGMVLVDLELTNEQGTSLSENVYWLGDGSPSYRQLNDLPSVPIDAKAVTERSGDETVIHLDLANTSRAASLNTKLTLQDRTGKRVLPAYYSDNYVSILPGKHASLEIRYPTTSVSGNVQVAIRGWNTTAKTITVNTP